jgi:molybdate/tungstate transport system substrate-binding protein
MNVSNSSHRPWRAAAVGSLLALSLGGVAALAPAAGAASANTVSVLYAGSLQGINDQVLGPAFTKADGVKYQGQGDSTLALAKEIVSGEVTGDIFEAVGTGGLTAVGTKLMPWAVSVASQPLVVMYNPNTKFAPEFKAIATGKKPLKDLFTLLETPGMKLGRTDPESDPQGQAFVLMVHLATLLYHLPADTPQKVLGSLENAKEVYSETALPAELQAGGVDASSGFLPQALQMKLPYITLPATLDFASASEASTYAKVSITLPNNGQKVVGAPLAIWAGPLYQTGSHAALGIEYLEFIMSAQGQADMKKYGFTPVTLPIYGKASAVPAKLLKEIQAK